MTSSRPPRGGASADGRARPTRHPVVQRVLDAPASAVYRAVVGVDRRAWAPDTRYRVQTALPPRFARLAFADGSLVGISISRQGNARTTVQIEITEAPPGIEPTALQQRWRDALLALAGQLDQEWD